MAGGFTGISGTLSTSSPGVTIVSGTATWPDLAAGGSATGVQPFVIRLDETVACFGPVGLDLTVTANEGGPFVIPITKTVGVPLEPDVPVAIPDANPTGATSTLVVANDVILTDVNVRVQINHTWIGDLFIVLRAPDNTEVVLLDRPGVPMSGAGCSDSNLDVTFDDASVFDPESHCTGTDPWFVGTAKPVGSLAVLNGKSAAGTWTLFVTDNSGQDIGAIVNWELITDPPISGICTVCVAVGDLSITKTDNANSATQGGSTTYTITVANAGPSPVPGASVTDTFPAALTCTWTCVGAGGGTCTAAGSGHINDTVTLPAGGSVIYTATCTISPSATGSLSNTATIGVPAGVTDPNLANNSATDTDTIVPPPAPDVSGTKTVAGTFAVGGTVTYTVTLSNAGPGPQGDNPGSEFTDVLPATLALVSASASSGTAAANVATNTVTWNGALPAGGSVTITIVATILPNAAGTTVLNQGSIAFDADGNGTNETTTPTSDPGGGDGNGTGFTVAPVTIPTLSTLGFFLLALVLATLGVAWQRRRGLA